MAGKMLSLPIWKSLLQCNLCSTSKSLDLPSFFGTSSLLAAQEKTAKNERSTVDKEDVERHTKVLKDWWNPLGTYKPLHSMNLIRVPFIRDGLVHRSKHERTMKPLKDMKVLDVGCGGGILSEALAKIGADVTGIDAGSELIELAKRHSIEEKTLENKPRYICTTVEDHVKDHKNYYDGVVASEVIEHVHNQELFVQSCVQALKPGGRVFITTPNRTRLSQVFGIWVAENVLNLLPKGTHEYDKFVTPTEVTFWLERNNCHVELTYGIIYYFFKNKWEFVNTQQFMFALQAVKLKE